MYSPLIIIELHYKQYRQIYVIKNIVYFANYYLKQLTTLQTMENPALLPTMKR